MVKKITLIVSILLILIGLGSAFLLKALGINPTLWLSMPEYSNFSSSSGQNQVAVSLNKVAENFEQITDFQFLPGSSHELFVLEKAGTLKYLNLRNSTQKQILSLPVLSQSEQGLLGIAIHPRYPAIPCIYLNYVIDHSNKEVSRVAEWCAEWEGDVQSWFMSKVIFEVEQPYGNHNAGHLIFDQHEYLYIPWGDGGSREDPHGHAQNLQSYLGKVLRVNPEPRNQSLAYSIPENNPFVGTPDIPDEIFAYGLRNPWKLAFDPKYRLIAADVGQDKWEEITFVLPGKDHGWNQVEGSHCFLENCRAENTVLPFIEYGHDLGRSVTGGYVYLSNRIPQLSGKYIFGDFVTGQLWAGELPEHIESYSLNRSEKAQSHVAITHLGQWPLLISTFARDAAGEIYLADFARGTIYKIEPSQEN